VALAWLAVLAFAAQSILMAIDEGIFHRRRGLPRWERIGHPLDTATVLACYGWLLASRPNAAALTVYAILVVGSSLFVTKDERIHARTCSPNEHLLHALLFVLHPIVLFGAGWIWWTGHLRPLLFVQALAAGAFAIHQIAFWSVRSWRRPA
jgi:hypothetical protein